MKKSVMMQFVKKAAVVLSVSMVLGLCGCGETPAVAEPSVSDAPQNSEASVETPVQETSSKMDALLGEWELIASISDDYEYSDVTDPAELTATISVFKEDGVYKLDYDMESYDSVEMYGVKLEEKTDKACFAGSVSADWYAKMNTRKKDYTYAVALTKEGTLAMQIHYAYDYEDESYSYDYYNIYVKVGAPDRQQIVDSYRYKETVTVSNMKELYNAIGSNKKIILKAGIYNISSLSERDKKNDNINYSYSYEFGEDYHIPGATIYAPYLRHLCLEAEEGAEVMICTEDYYVAPLAFYSCSDVVLKNLTLGHEVEKGYCTGAVVSFESCDDVEINGCNLYGSGAYGIDATYSYHVNVKNCDIYECTYGLVSLNGCGYWNFDDCKLRDSEEYDMFDMPDCYEIYFNNCSVTGNKVGDYSSLISANDDAWIFFDNCTFKNNQYKNFMNGSVHMSNCTIDDN